VSTPGALEDLEVDSDSCCQSECLPPDLREPLVPCGNGAAKGLTPREHGLWSLGVVPLEVIRTHMYQSK